MKLLSNVVEQEQQQQKRGSLLSLFVELFKGLRDDLLLFMIMIIVSSFSRLPLGLSQLRIGGTVCSLAASISS